mmetsp:Transcript_16548/g.35823  ORF Transcript_16548/g.35823 Transcript_16548/m.35823 type:complete len:271 (+) Transcript_16548:2508-3320(+)
MQEGFISNRTNLLLCSTCQHAYKNPLLGNICPVTRIDVVGGGSGLVLLDGTKHSIPISHKIPMFWHLTKRVYEVIRQVNQDLVNRTIAVGHSMGSEGGDGLNLLGSFTFSVGVSCGLCLLVAFIKCLELLKDEVESVFANLCRCIWSQRPLVNHTPHVIIINIIQESILQQHQSQSHSLLLHLLILINHTLRNPFQEFGNHIHQRLQINLIHHQMLIPHSTSLAAGCIAYGKEWTEQSGKGRRTDVVGFVVHQPSKVFEVLVAEEDVRAL